MKQKFLACLFFAALSASPLVLHAQTDTVFNPMAIERLSSDGLAVLDKVLQIEDDIERHLALSNFINTYGEWIPIRVGASESRLHISAILLQQKMELDAIDLIKSKRVKTWFSYRFDTGVANDFMYALDTGSFQYIQALIEHAPQGVNTEFPVTLQGDKVTPIALLATEKYRQSPQYEVILRALLNAGANPYQEMSNGLSPMIIASSSNNTQFIRMIHAYDAEKKGAASDLFKNTPLQADEIFEMQAIADALIERQAQGRDQYSFEKLHELWIQMILKGYNLPADIIYERLLAFEGFNADYRVNNGGLNGLMAVALSTNYGGNVEYGKKLIDRGADPKTLISVGNDDAGKPIHVNLIQLSFQNDNHKVVTLFIQNGVNFIFSSEDEETLILSEAMEQRAFRSAFVIKEALEASFKQLSSDTQE